MIEEFVSKVAEVYRTGNATEHSYRPALQKLFDSLDPEVSALNEPRRVKVGAPDFSLSRSEIVIGHCEAKDLSVDLEAMKDANLTQKKRYTEGLANLLYTNCLEWLWYRDGELKHKVRIGDFLMGVQPIPANYAALEALLREFIAQTPQTITSSRALAERMAGKAVLIKDVLANSLMEDKDGSSELMDQYNAFKEHLIHDISIADFADIYAETITYGMFAARLHDTGLDTFDRQEALELLPKSNPFLRNLFGYIAGPNLDPRISWIIDDLARLFRASNVSVLMEKYGKTTQRNDPFLHFYEDFLKAYNPAKRDARGVWYTPEPVVNFIVRAVDEVLKSEFGLAEGLADTSKVTIDWDTGQRGTTKAGKLTKSTRTTTVKKEVHRVQILDPATGTGTFLAEVIKQIAPRVKNKAPASWAGYVERDLIPRLHGFELLMASYAMCHLKLDMVLREYGYEPTAKPPRVSVYLTNSLEEGAAANQTLPFAQWLSNEVKEANKIKRDMPIMCVIGNPPYSGISQNRGAWIENLVAAYKVEPGGSERLQERKHWLNDDYVKFIRMSEALIERNGSGVLGFITNHGYLDNPTFRGMRWRLATTFDKIFVIDLHGNSNKREVSPDGRPDKNVFDIQQGVAIVVAIKRPVEKPSSPRLAQISHTELWGDRQSKYDWLWNSSLQVTDKSQLEDLKPPYFMFGGEDTGRAEYERGFALNEFFNVSCTGIISARDDLTVDFSSTDLLAKLQRFLRADRNHADVRREFFSDRKAGSYAPGDSRGWKLELKRPILQRRGVGGIELRPILYRPFDMRAIAYDDDIVDWPRRDLMGSFASGQDIALLSPRMTSDDYSPLVTDALISNKAGSRYDQTYFFPLHIAPQGLDQTRRVNFDEKLYSKLRKIATREKSSEPDEVAVFDYIYGVLHCPAYRETYAEFLKIDFPRIAWPASADVFWDVSDKGGQLRRLHLMEAEAIGDTSYPFTGDEGEGKSKIEKPEYRGGAVWINKHQRFENAPEVSWSFYIGGYQPAQKWLKDRKGRTLDYNDVQHYQRILKILAETDRIMKTIEMPLE
ncbi:MAG: DNA methyltransferase [Xanthobacteraceae bacterium]|nr:DNA methyltransferase [Xanthobacteraceae bacterium]QYK46510.1 MAG: DNA methyltransferase [Xanthobacteraceae bacterium]